MAAINAAYRLLSDPRQRAAYDAQRYLSRAPTGTYRPVPPSVRVAYQAPPPTTPPTTLQRRVDRLVAVIGVVLLVLIGFYTINVLPYMDPQQSGSRRIPVARSNAPVPTVSVAGATTGAGGAADPGEHVSGAPVADRIRGDANLKSFPGAVLVPPVSLPPFSSLPIQRIEASGQFNPRYAVYYGDLITGGADVTGSVGRAGFDNSTPHLADCAPDAAYCAGPVPGQTSGPPGLEVFRGDALVADNPAYITHRVNTGAFWSVYWYEPRTNMSYTLDLSRSVAQRFGNGNIESDTVAARAVAGLAAQLVRLP
jgi:hypothetical protein